MYTAEANEIYQKMCEKYRRDPLNITHSDDFLFDCINEALKQVKKNVVLDNVIDCCKQVDNLELTNNWGVRRCKKCGSLVDTSGR